MAKKSLVRAGDRAQQLVSALLKTGDIAAAAKEIGMTEHEARSCMRKTNVKHILICEYSQMLICDLAPLAMSQMKHMLKAGKAATGMIDLCKTVLDRIGLSAAKPMDPAAHDTQPVEEMSIAELEAFIAKKEASLKDVTPHNAPALQDKATQPADIFD